MSNPAPGKRRFNFKSVQFRRLTMNRFTEAQPLSWIDAPKMVWGTQNESRGQTLINWRACKSVGGQHATDLPLGSRRTQNKKKYLVHSDQVLLSQNL